MRALHTVGDERCRRVLVLEDDDNLREMYSCILACLGYKVDSAGDGEAGWQLLSQSEDAPPVNYDLLVTDNNMPRLSGVNLIKRLRSAGIHLPVIMVSSAIPPEAHLLDLAAFISKPFGMDELLSTIERVLASVEHTCAVKS
jgi:two-component system OmpR family response regulator